MKTFLLNVVNIEESLFSAQITALRVTTENGDVGILQGHTPLLASIKPGNLKITDINLTEEVFYISGGFLDVQPDIVTILADTVIHSKDIDAKTVLENKNRLEGLLHSKASTSTEYVLQLTQELAKLRTALLLDNLKNFKKYK